MLVVIKLVAETNSETAAEAAPAVPGGSADETERIAQKEDEGEIGFQVRACVLASCSLTIEAKSEVKGLISYFKTFDDIVLLTVWVKILQCIENRSFILQAGNIPLDVEAANIKALQEEMQVLCSKWNSLLVEATIVAQAMDVSDHFQSRERRKRKRKRMPDETTQDETTEDSAENAFHNNIFFVAMEHN